MPSYTKFLKEIPSNKRKLQEHAMVFFREECSAILQNKLPPKFEDPGSFSIPCAVGDVLISRALCNLGVSVSLMPYSIYKRLNKITRPPRRSFLQLYMQSRNFDLTSYVFSKVIIYTDHSTLKHLLDKADSKP